MISTQTKQEVTPITNTTTIPQEGRASSPRPSKTFHSKPCVKCNSTLRQTCDKSCAACRRRKHSATYQPGIRLRKIATLYHGKPCRRCRNTARYKSSRACVECASIARTGKPRRPWWQRLGRKRASGLMAMPHDRATELIALL